MMRTLTRSTALAFAVPLLLLTNLYVFAVGVRISTGQWSDLSDLPPTLFAWEGVATLPIVALLFFLAPGALVATVVAAVFRLKKTRNALLAFFLSAAIAIAVVRIDPGGFLAWFMD